MTNELVQTVNAYVQVGKDLNMQLRRFWEVEEINGDIVLSNDELLCEDHYQANTVRLASGRYQVRLTFKCNVPQTWGNARQSH